MLYCNIIHINLLNYVFLKSFDLDLCEIIISACDIFFILYNKLADKSCSQPDLVDYVNNLDDHIYEYFILPCSDNLQILSEYIMKREFDNLNNSLNKYFI